MGAAVLFKMRMSCMAFCGHLADQAGLSWVMYLLNKQSQVSFR